MTFGAAALLVLACGAGESDSTPFPFGRAHADCGPADGPAVRIQLASSALAADLAVPAPRPSLELVLNSTITGAGDRSFLIESEGRGVASTAHGILCEANGHCVSAKSGRIRLDHVAGSPSEITGTYDVTLEDGARHSGRFKAAWVAFSPMCG